jgi:methionyl-tRNA formyltransferase
MMESSAKPALVFMGTPEFAVPTLRHLAEQKFPITAVVTRPDKPQGRGHQERPPAVKVLAQELGIPVWQPENVNTPEFLVALKQAVVEVVVVAAFGQILKSGLLYGLPLGCVNLHASLLPKYRGAAPIQWAIARGEAITGITVQKMAERVDSGAILVQRTTPIDPDENAETLLLRLANLGGAAMEDALMQLKVAEGKLGQAQDEAQVTMAPRLQREDGKIDWHWMGAEIHNRVRGFYPWPGTHAQYGGERIKIIRTLRSGEKAPEGALPGIILRVEPESGWLVAAGQGTTVWVHSVQCANTKVMTSQAYTCGYRCGAGDHLE